MKTTMKRIFSLLIVLVMVCGMLPMAASAAETTYTFSSYTAGTQYAENEVHVLDDDVTVVTTQCHFTTQLRIYSSSDHNGYAIINCTSAGKSFAGLTVNAGNKADTLNLYGSNDDGATWTSIGSVTTASSYKDLTYDFDGKTYTSLKLDVAGANQVRVANMKVTVAGGCSHNYIGEITTAATCTEDGVKTFTCSLCNDSYTEVISATGHNYVDGVCESCGDTQFSISFSVNGTVSETIPYVSGGIGMPAGNDNGSYTFAGWTDAAITTEGTVAPGTVYAAGQVVEFDAATTLYALYTRSEGSTATEYEEKALAEIGTADLFVIVGTNATASYALTSANGSSSAPGMVTVTAADGKLSGTPADTILWTLSKDGENYIFHPNGDTSKWLFCNNSNNGVRVGTEAAKTFVLDASGYLKNVTQSRYLGIYNNQDWRCYTNTTGNTANQTFKFYAKPTATIYYTTTIGCNHDYEGEVKTAATCTEDGVMTYTCSACGDSYEDLIPATGHSYDEGTVTTAATCTEDGVKTYTCSVCGGTKEEAVAKAHDFTNGDCTCGHPAPDSVLTIAEANQWGLTYDKKTYSTGKYYIEGTIESIVNTTYGNLYIQDADGNKFYIYGLYSEDGSVRYDAMETKPAVGDTIKIYTVIGTYDGTTAQAKDAWLVVDYVKKYNVELTDKIGMNFKLSADVTSATVTFGGETTTVALDTLPTDENGLRIYNLKMAAAQMADEVVWLFNGKTEATYSVRGYADVVLSGEYGANEKALVRAMLHYGAAAQDYFNYNDGDYADAGMTDTVTNPIQAAEMVPTTGETAGIVHYGSTLVYRDRVAVRVYFMLTGDAVIGDYTFTANGEAVEAQEGSNGLYYVEIADIAPQNLDDAVTVTVNDGLTVTYSALNYITRMVNKTEDNALKTLLQQLYDYYMAAEYLVENGPDDFETEPDVVG